MMTRIAALVVLGALWLAAAGCEGDNMPGNEPAAQGLPQNEGPAGSNDPGVSPAPAEEPAATPSPEQPAPPPPN
jgi:hypothetical protein